jgi:hypothetical protein
LVFPSSLSVYSNEPRRTRSGSPVFFSMAHSCLQINPKVLTAWSGASDGGEKGVVDRDRKVQTDNLFRESAGNAGLFF